MSTNMSQKKNNPVSAESLKSEIANWIDQDAEGGGAWSMFTLYTIKDMQKDFDVTMQYLADISKKQFDYICEAIDEVVYHYQRIEMVELIESLYEKFYGNDRDNDFYHNNIECLRNCIKK